MGPLACLPPATTAASVRSRRLAGTPLMSKTVNGIRDTVAGNGGEGRGEGNRRPARATFSRSGQSAALGARHRPSLFPFLKFRPISADYLTSRAGGQDRRRAIAATTSRAAILSSALRLGLNTEPAYPEAERPRCSWVDYLWFLESTMPRYALDEYVQEHLADDAVNVNCVASWRARGDAAGSVESLSVDLHNGWHFDSRALEWARRCTGPNLAGTEKE
jgi:hypothetical protein